MKAVVAERGQVTIPKALRDRLGIGPKTVLDFEERDGLLVAGKVVREGDAVDRVIGCLSLEKTTDELMRDLRGDS